SVARGCKRQVRVPDSRLQTPDFRWCRNHRRFLKPVVCSLEPVVILAPCMRIVDLIIGKRDGRRLSRDEIDAFISGVTTGEIPDYQASALLMAIFLRGLDAEETGWLTDAMVRSGGRVDLSSLSG